MAVHRLLMGGEGFGDRGGQRCQHPIHHHLAVVVRIILRPAHRLQIVVIMTTAFAEIGEIAIGKMGNMLLHIFLRQRNKQRADRIAHAARAAVQHHPDPIGLIEADLDKVVACAERSQMLVVIGFQQLRIALCQALKSSGQPRPVRIDVRRRLMPCSFIPFASAAAAPVRHGLLDGAAQAQQAVRQIGCHQRGAYRDHATADVDADGRRNNGAQRRDHAANGGAFPQMHIRHNGHVFKNKRHAGRIQQLLFGFWLDGDPLCPHFYRRAGARLEQVKLRFHHFFFVAVCVSLYIANSVPKTVISEK